MAGIRESLVRVAVGLEDLDDIKADLRTGLDAIAAPAGARAASG